MVSKQKATGRASSVPVGLAYGGMISLLVTMACAAVIAKMVDGEVIEESSIGYGIMILLLLASFTGAMTSYRKIKRQRAIICLASGLVYFGILMSITALFFGGQYSAVGVTALMVFCGSMLAVLLGMQQGNRQKKHKIKLGHR